MKLFLSFIILGTIVFHCKGKAVSSEECNPVVESMLGNISSVLVDKSPEEIQQLKNLTRPVLQKECETGKYDLGCLKTAKSIEQLQACKK
ncbi:MAG: TIGR04454 family lipoprotein [Leptospiraceae bacterium]|nr:TIGR04454 family lipoprotein [Leptospiraceae bacterium]